MRITLFIHVYKLFYCWIKCVLMFFKNLLLIFSYTVVLMCFLNKLRMMTMTFTVYYICDPNYFSVIRNHSQCRTVLENLTVNSTVQIYSNSELTRNRLIATVNTHADAYVQL